ncbi:hypothetical protein BD410DRAFT_82872 [Rickenella mellea]|uniref:Uncharacterized protein n=1 Tax=Rickenella mellea TaxID=50990 RepID=A0A4Y7PK63_9AGAM|nr:hypothetical protein BD410DRAFT_82872 [Rickenella mellea]
MLWCPKNSYKSKQPMRQQVGSGGNCMTDGMAFFFALPVRIVASRRHDGMKSRVRFWGLVAAKNVDKGNSAGK